MGLAMAVTIIGLKLVGLVLIVALLIIPPVAARFWTERVGAMVWIAGGQLGALGPISGPRFLPRPPTCPRARSLCWSWRRVSRFRCCWHPRAGCCGGPCAMHGLAPPDEERVMGAEFVQFSLTPMLIGTLAAMACALPGNFLILRRQALIGDAISHVVLPGIVVGFLVSG